MPQEYWHALTGGKTSLLSSTPIPYTSPILSPPFPPNKIRLAVEDATSWNHEFWHKRNTEFFAAREKFVRSSINKARVSQVEQTDKDNSEAIDQSPRPSTTAVSTEEMSLFYSKFLSDNHQAHLLYMKGWYLRNFRVLKTGLMWFLSEIKIGRR